MPQEVDRPCPESSALLVCECGQVLITCHVEGCTAMHTWRQVTACGVCTATGGQVIEEAPSILARAQRVLAGGPGTLSKSPLRYPQGIGPTALVAGEGCYVTGDNHQVYLDTVAALGPVILGYGKSEITEAVMAQVQHGTSFSMLDPLEVEVGEKLCELLPCAEMVRFCKNGTDATNMAVRLMRAVTGKRHVIFVGYAGGAADSYGVTTDKRAGILDEIAPYNHQVPWGNTGALTDVLMEADDDLAGMLVEVPPIPWGTSPAAIAFTLRQYAWVAHTAHALFTLDEIVTFPRYGLHGVQHVLDVIPDLCCVSKGIANGFPLAALVGKRAFMERLNAGDIFASWTFAGETTALAACQATLAVLQTTDALAHLRRQGQYYGDGLHMLFVASGLPVTLWGEPSRLAVRWHDVSPTIPKEILRTWWLAEHMRREVLMGIGVIFPMACWQDADVARLLTVAKEVITCMRAALDTGTLVTACPCPVITDVLAVRSS